MQTGTHDILGYLRRRLREVGSDNWEFIAQQAGVSSHLLRHLVWENRDSRVGTVQPLLNYFQVLDGLVERSQPGFEPPPRNGARKRRQKSSE